MSCACGFPFEDCDEIATVWRERRVSATRREHRCYECGESIPAGGWTSGEIEPYLDRHPEILKDLDPDVVNGIMPDGSRVGEAPDIRERPEPEKWTPDWHIAQAAQGGPRFGDRLRALIAPMEGLAGPLVMRLRALSDEIDRDRDALQCERIADEHEEGYRRALQDLRRKVDELVEELRYTADYAGAGQEDSHDVVEVEPLLAGLREIFEAREAASKAIELTVLPQLIGFDLWPVIMVKTERSARFLTPDEAMDVVRRFSL